MYKAQKNTSLQQLVWDTSQLGTATLYSKSSPVHCLEYNTHQSSNELALKPFRYEVVGPQGGGGQCEQSNT